MNIYAALIAILRDVEAIGKNKKNVQQDYKFRGIDDMYNELHDLFARYGVFITSETVATEREERQTKNGGVLIYTILDVKFSFYADDGSFVSSITKGEAMDSGDKSCNKAMSTALKYALMQMFLIPTDELKDSDADTHTVSPKTSDKKEGNEKPWFNEKPNFENFKQGVLEGTIAAQTYEEAVALIRAKYKLSKDMDAKVKAFYQQA